MAYRREWQAASAQWVSVLEEIGWKCVRPDRLLNILHLLEPKISERQRKCFAHIIVRCSEMQIPPGLAIPSSRAAIFTLSPSRSPPRTITSPTCTPIRNADDDPQKHPGSFARGHPGLCSALDGIHRARELGQDTIASRVRDPPTMVSNQPVHDLAMGD